MDKNAPPIKTLDSLEPSEIKRIERQVKSDYDYQQELTKELDSYKTDFDQNVVNKITLWKVNRYAKLSDKTLARINEISPDDRALDEKLTRELLTELLPIRGMRLSMASTLFRFRNPHIYQIIDHHIFRVVKGQNLFFPQDVGEQMDLYFDYLSSLRAVCEQFSIDYTTADRTLYRIDRVLLNKNTFPRTRH